MLKLDNNALLRDAAYIDGEWRGARSGTRFAVKNPATGVAMLLGTMAAFAVTVPVNALRVETKGCGCPAGQVVRKASGPKGTAVMFNE